MGGGKNCRFRVYIFSGWPLKGIGGSGVKKGCLVVFKDLNEPESLLFTECKSFISFKSYYNFNFGNLVGSLINLRTKMKF